MVAEEQTVFTGVGHQAVLVCEVRRKNIWICPENIYTLHSAGARISARGGGVVPRHAGAGAGQQDVPRGRGHQEEPRHPPRQGGGVLRLQVRGENIETLRKNI